MSETVPFVRYVAETASILRHLRYGKPITRNDNRFSLAREAQASRTVAIHCFGSFIEAKRPQEVFELVVGHALAYRREEGARFFEPIRQSQTEGCNRQGVDVRVRSIDNLTGQARGFVEPA